MKKGFASSRDQIASNRWRAWQQATSGRNRVTANIVDRLEFGDALFEVDARRASQWNALVHWLKQTQEDLAMDPNLFHLDWDRLLEVLAAIVVLSFLLERCLALLFEHRVFIERLGEKGVKEPISFALSLLVCWRWDFDAMSMILLTEKTSFLGEVITAGVIAGGSKASLKLFRDVLGLRSTAEKERQLRVEARVLAVEPVAETPTPANPSPRDNAKCEKPM